MILLLYQISIVIIEYSKYQIITRLEVNENTIIPVIHFSSSTQIRDLNKLIDIYPDAAIDLKYNDGIPQFRKGILKLIAAQKYSLLLLKENKFEDFKRIFISDSIIKTCYLQTDSGITKCADPESNLRIEYNNIFQVDSFKYFSQNSNYTTTKHKFNPFPEKIIVKIHDLLFSYVETSSKPYFLIENLLFLEKNSTTRISLESYSVNRLSLSDHKCIPEEEIGNYGQEYFDNCELDCILDSINKTHGCLISYFKGLFLRINRDLILKKYRICYSSKLHNTTIYFMIMDKCKNECLNKCKTIEFQMEY